MSLSIRSTSHDRAAASDRGCCVRAVPAFSKPLAGRRAPIEDPQPESTARGDPPALAIRDLTVTYGEIVAVRGLSMQVEVGEVVCLLGRNGAGKSSILNAILGVILPTAGRIHMHGLDITTRPIEDRVRLGLAMSPEGRRIFASLTVWENLRLAGSRLSKARFQERLEELVTLFPVLSQKLRSGAGSLSGGQQQQLALARALMVGAEVLVLDEPSLGLDPLNTRNIFEALTDLKSKNMTIVLAEQNVERALHLADRAYVLASGNLVLQGPTSSLPTADIENAYLGIAAGHA